MTTDDRDLEMQRRLRDALTGAASGVQPAGDGLQRIQGRIASRRARLRWLRPAAAVLSAAVVAGGIAGGVAIANSGGGGNGPSRLRVPPAHGSASPTPTSASFYGVQGGKLMSFDAATGQPQGTVPDSGSYPPVGNGEVGQVAEVHRVGGTLYFTYGAAGCATELRSVASGGGGSTAVAAARTGDAITGFDVNAGGALVYFERGCGTAAGQGALEFEKSQADARGITFGSIPPLVVGDPVWNADGTHVEAFLRTGMEGYLAEYDSTHPGTDTMPAADACSVDPNAGLVGALATGPDGSLWFAAQTGTSMQVYSCGSGRPTVELTVPVNSTPASLSVSADGQVLLADASGAVWSGAAGHSPTRLATGGPVTSLTW
jgi:hypothetical protein